MSNDTKCEPGLFCWNELLTGDVKKAQSFYTALFGWTARALEVEEKNKTDEDVSYTVFKSGDKDIGGMMQIPKEKADHMPPHWMSYISVDDLDKTVSKAKELGATIVKPATTVPDMGRFAIIQDPTGAYIALWEAK